MAHMIVCTYPVHDFKIALCVRAKLKNLNGLCNYRKSEKIIGTVQIETVAYGSEKRSGGLAPTDPPSKNNIKAPLPSLLFRCKSTACHALNNDSVNAARPL